MKRHVSLLVAALLGLAASVWMSGPAAAAVRSCESLKSISFKDARIDIAEEVHPDPAWAYPPSAINVLARIDPAGALNVQVPFCRVVGVIETEIRFELWLPDAWNGKYQQVGNSGYTGAMNFPTMGGAIAKGYATASTDLGHDSANVIQVDWMVGHKERIVNFGYRAHHVVSRIAKRIVDSYYGKQPAYSYFVGCSSGGWQGLTEIQKYPEDFDGIVAGAPAHNFVRLNLRGTVVAQMSLKHPEGNLSADQAKLIAQAAIERCDPEDGVTDGIVSDPLHCDFDPKQLQCQADESGESCLSAPQVERARALYGPIRSKGGIELYPGPIYGVNIRGRFSSAQSTPKISEPLYNALKEFGRAPQWTAATFDADRDIPKMDKVLGPVLSSVDPDISEFKARGGKVVVWQGWDDAAISPYNTVHYYDTVGKRLGVNMDDFYRMFFVPGMNHCGAGAKGPNKFDVVDALANWLEKGVAPSRIEATQEKDGAVIRTRPLCMYPEVAKYTGTGGSTDEAKNFTCVRP